MVNPLKSESCVVVRSAYDAADLVLVNGQVHTPEVVGATAVAVRDEIIVAIGSDSHVNDYIGPDTRVIDAKKKHVLPGFIDVHTHLDAIADAQSVIDVKIPPLKDIDAMLQKIKLASQNLNCDEWIVATGTYGQPFPDRYQIDAYVSRNPVVIRESIHVQYLNSRALKEIGITKNFQTPAGGSLARDHQGEPTGRIQELFYMWTSKLPQPTDDERKNQLLGVLNTFSSFGVTSVGDFPQPRSIKLYQQLKQEGRLPVRLRFNMFACGEKAAEPREDHSTKDHIVSIEDNYDNFLLSFGLYTGFGDNWTRIGGAKLFVDGESFSAVQYKDPLARDEWKGNLKLSPENLNAFVARAHRAGWQMLIHAVGDKSQDMSLDAIENAQILYYRSDPRHRIEHMAVNEAGPTTPEMIERAKRLGVIPVLTANWISNPEVTQAPTEYAPLIYGTLVKRGVIIPGSSDSDGTEGSEVLNPFFGIWAQVTRKTVQGDLSAPEEAISVEEAIKGWTQDSAYSEFSEDYKGTIQSGKLGDFIIVSENPLEVQPEALRDLKVIMTIVGGRVVYQL